MKAEVLAVVSELLRRLGYDVHTTDNGAEGLERFDREGAASSSAM